MAAASRQHIYQTIQTSLAHIPNYIGQESPDDYCNKIQQAISFTNTMIADVNNANANTFTDVHKADIYKSKMAGKYVPVPAQHPAGTNIDTSALFRAWFRHKYYELTIGTRQASLTKLTQEKFLPIDTPETYKERIRLLLLQTPNNNADALAIL
ncbi:1570_t:CDS:1 [Ambispora gerdemannii]|uniref:1570_t:CDS:1 n=1 Tax=Ambispora gerdemannii TaxID=144530 RepID=A0A9N9CHH8_9GLOM|nr:1570_t:CDS:1 [Ambispora gerdemannii]